MPTIHGTPVSPFVRKTLVCLLEKGVAHEVNPILPFPAPAEFLALSPLGKIPALTEGDFALPDSSAICGYIEKRWPEPALYPADPEGYGRALWFEDWADGELSKATAGIFFHRVAMKMMKREPNEAAVAAIKQDLQPGLFNYLEGQIGDRAWLVGDSFSIADVAVTCQFVQMLYAGEELPAACPNISRYINQHMRRDSFRQLINADPFISID